MKKYYVLTPYQVEEMRSIQNKISRNIELLKEQLSGSDDANIIIDNISLLNEEILEILEDE